MLATANEAFGDGFQFFPACADTSGFFGRDMVVDGGARDDREEIGELLDDLICSGDEKVGMRPAGFGILDEETAGAFAEPLDKARIICASEEGLDPVKGIGGPASGCLVRFGPFVDERQGQAEFGSDLFGARFGEDIMQQFVGLHGKRIGEQGPVEQSVRRVGAIGMQRFWIKRAEYEAGCHTVHGVVARRVGTGGAGGERVDWWIGQGVALWLARKVGPALN